MIKQILIGTASILMLTACGGSDTKKVNPVPSISPSQSPMSKKDKALKKIQSYAESNGNKATPTLQDYLNIGIKGVTSTNLADINEVIENSSASEVDSTIKIQTLVDATGPDKDAPVITIKGKNPLYRQLSRQYYEYGATAEDAIDGTVKVKTTGKINIHKIGTYTITYTAKDKAGNSSQKTRKVIVQAITHHGLKYGTVISPYTGRIWLDRNIGATKVCDNTNDSYNLQDGCLGDYYQWGRNPDGHEKKNSPSTLQKGKTITDSGNKFVIGHKDWTSATNRTANWAATDGRSVCPVNYRVPTLKELKIELTKANLNKWTDPLRATSFLKLSYTGIRDGHNGEYRYEVSKEYFATRIWTNTVDTHGNTYFYDSTPLYGEDNFFTTEAESYYDDTKYGRSGGYSVRCIQN